MKSNIRIELSNITYSHISYVIYNFHEVVGTVTLLVSDLYFLVDLYIEIEFRRKGIAKYLLDFFKIKKLQCTTWNDVGNCFYKSVGFKEIESNIFLITYERN